MEDNVKRWLSQQCIGYQKTGEQVTHVVMRGKVELMDGSIYEAWRVDPVGLLDGTPYYACPRIDVPVKGNK